MHDRMSDMQTIVEIWLRTVIRLMHVVHISVDSRQHLG